MLPAKPRPRTGPWEPGDCPAEALGSRTPQGGWLWELSLCEALRRGAPQRGASSLPGVLPSSRWAAAYVGSAWWLPGSVVALSELLMGSRLPAGADAAARPPMGRGAGHGGHGGRSPCPRTWRRIWHRRRCKRSTVELPAHSYPALRGTDEAVRLRRGRTGSAEVPDVSLLDSVWPQPMPPPLQLLARTSGSGRRAQAGAHPAATEEHPPHVARGSARQQCPQCKCFVSPEHVAMAAEAPGSVLFATGGKSFRRKVLGSHAYKGAPRETFFHFFISQLSHS